MISCQKCRKNLQITYKRENIRSYHVSPLIKDFLACLISSGLSFSTWPLNSSSDIWLAGLGPFSSMPFERCSLFCPLLSAMLSLELWLGPFGTQIFSTDLWIHLDYRTQILKILDEWTWNSYRLQPSDEQFELRSSVSAVSSATWLI